MKMNATRKTAVPKNPKLKLRAAAKPVTVKGKKKAAASATTTAAKPKTPELVFPTQSSYCLLENISDNHDRFPIEA